MKQYFSSLLVCILIFVTHFELRVVVLSPCSRGREEYGRNFDNKQQKTSISFFKLVLIHSLSLLEQNTM